MKKSAVIHRGNRIGDMRHLVRVHDRSITAPTFGSVDFGEDFEGTQAWAAIRTTSGKIVMDDVGVDANATHEIFIRYDSNVTSETFIQVDDGRRFRVLSVENFDERGEYMKLTASDRGINEAAKA